MCVRIHAGRSRTPFVIALVLGSLAFACALPAQSSARGTPTPVPSANTTGSRTNSADHDISGMGLLDDLRDDPSLRVSRLNAHRDEIKKRMEQNATRLMLLTAELRSDLQTREPTEADAKRLDEIVKLARAVREQMKQ